MAKKIRFPLEMADGVHVRTLAELKEHFDAERVVGYYLDGKLKTWLDDRYIEKEAAAVDALARDDEELAQKLCEIFGVEYLGDLDPEEIAYRNERIARLKQLTDDPEIIKQVDIVAFDQDDLFDRYDEGRTKIILAQGEFDIPESKRDIEYVRLGEQSQTADHETDRKQASQDAVGGGFEYIIKVTNDDYYMSLEFIIDLLIFLYKENVLDYATASLLSTLALGDDVDPYYVLDGRIKYTSFDQAEKVVLLINDYYMDYFFRNTGDVPPAPLVVIGERRIEPHTDDYSLRFRLPARNIMNAAHGQPIYDNIINAIKGMPNLIIEEFPNFALGFDKVVIYKNISKDMIQELFKEKFAPLGCELSFDDRTNIYTISRSF